MSERKYSKPRQPKWMERWHIPGEDFRAVRLKRSCFPPFVPFFFLLSCCFSPYFFEISETEVVFFA